MTGATFLGRFRLEVTRADIGNMLRHMSNRRLERAVYAAIEFFQFQTACLRFLDVPIKAARNFTQP